jgi:hypothetical protein
MTTLSTLMSRHAVEIPAHLAADADVPLLSGRQRQGDVLIRPTRPGIVVGTTPIPPEGIPVVRGEAGGNTHLLVGAGQWAANTTDPMVMGTLDVPLGGSAYLLHPEHGATGIAPGSYLVRRQREQADVVRMVQD